MTTHKATAIEKTLEILLAFDPHNQELGTSEVSQKLGFHKATTSRILLTLAEHGFVRQNPHTKKFSLGPAIHRLGSALTNSLSTDVIQIAKPFVDQLRDQLGETITLELWSDNSTVMTYIAENGRLMRVAGRVGDRLPFHAAAGAKAILAYFDPVKIEPMFLPQPERLTPATVTDPVIFQDQLTRFKQQGFAVDYEGIDIGISAIGAPIFNHLGDPFAAVVVVTPTQRLSTDPDSDTVINLKQTAQKISEQFFYANGNG